MILWSELSRIDGDSEGKLSIVEEDFHQSRSSN